MEKIVSVIMPVHNGEAYLREAIGSILNQTFRDFELILIDDASDDHTPEIIKEYADTRIRILTNAGNQGLTRNLNRAVDIAEGRYIARMDADDIALPERLARQVAFMEKHPDHGLCGTWAKTFGAYEEPVNFPTRHEELKCCLLFQNPVVHPSVMFRAAIIKKIRYDETLRVAQDYELWQRIARHTKIANLPEYLLRYRVHETSTSSTRQAQQEEVRNKVIYNYLHALGIEPTPKELEIHNTIARVKTDKDRLDLNYLPHMYLWMNKLLRHNRPRKIFDQSTLEQIFCFRWLLTCHFTKNYRMLVKAPFYWPFRSFWPAARLLWSKKKK